MSRLKAISSGPLAEGTAEEIGPHLTLSFQTERSNVVKNNEVPPEPPYSTPSAVSHRTCLLDPSQALLPCSGHSSAPQCPFNLFYIAISVINEFHTAG